MKHEKPINEESFKALGVHEEVLRAINDQRFTKPTKIQVKAIPLILNNKDVIAGSETGSGKTLAFSCGIIQKAKQGMGIQALVLVPTRELAEQVAEAFKTFSKYKHLNVTTVFGGVSINPQISKLRRTEIVIGTPGRILDHLNRRTIDFKKVNTLVLDEADMMLDMGFLPDVERIISCVPKNRQTLLFSATISTDLEHLTNKHMINPVSVAADEYVDASKLEQVYFDVPNKKKFSLLVNLLKEEKSDLVMVFCNTRDNTDFVAKNLKLNKIQSQAIHGGLTQSKRSKILEGFHKGRVYVLVCTDVAARGLDIKGVSHVYNYDTCKDPKQYVHRIGRTARAGKDGKAITLLSERDHDNFSRVLNTNNVDVHKEDLPRLERVEMKFKTPAGNGRRPNFRSNNQRAGGWKRSRYGPSRQGRASSY